MGEVIRTVNRMTVLLGALAVVGGAVGGCGEEPAASEPAPVSSTTAPSPSPAESATTAPSTAPTSAGPTARTISITVRGGRLTGDTGRVAVALGTPITLSVTSDVADEVHVHGYDLTADASAGGTASINFTVDIPGIFEVELEESGLQLLELQVS